MNIWFDGKIHPVGDSPVSVMSHALHYGTAVFEGIRSYKTNLGYSPFKLDAHILRLFRSACAVGLQIPFSEREIAEAINRVMMENDLQEAYIRPLVFFGAGSMGLDVRTTTSANPTHVMISAWSWPSYFDGPGRGLRAVISNHRRRFSSSALSQAKAAGHYLSSCCAHMEAKGRGFDEAILLDDENHLAEASAANLFLVHDGLISTPFPYSALRGITRETVMELARTAGYRVVERSLSVADLLSADEAFLTGTACEVVPVVEVNGQSIGTGSVGRVTSRMAGLYAQEVRREPVMSSPQPSKTAGRRRPAVRQM
jgi:branched-chain amino acid aminotransferase